MEIWVLEIFDGGEEWLPMSMKSREEEAIEEQKNQEKIEPECEFRTTKYFSSDLKSHEFAKLSKALEQFGPREDLDRLLVD